MSTKRRSDRRRPSPRFVVCIDNAGYPASLELHKIYQVLADADAARDGDVRIVDESGKTYLYPAEWFATLDLPQRVKEFASSSVAAASVTHKYSRLSIVTAPWA